MTKKEFDEKYVNDNKAVWCPTKGLASGFLKLANTFGYTLKEYDCETSFGVFGCETIYIIQKSTKNITFHRYEYYEDTNIIVRFEDNNSDNVYLGENIIITPTEIIFKDKISIKLTKQEFESMKRQFAEL